MCLAMFWSRDRGERARHDYGAIIYLGPRDVYTCGFARVVSFLRFSAAGVGVCIPVVGKFGREIWVRILKSMRALENNRGKWDKMEIIVGTR